MPSWKNSPESPLVTTRRPGRQSIEKQNRKPWRVWGLERERSIPEARRRRGTGLRVGGGRGRGTGSRPQMKTTRSRGTLLARLERLEYRAQALRTIKVRYGNAQKQD